MENKIWLQQCNFVHLGTLVVGDGTPICAVCGTKYELEKSKEKDIPKPDWKIMSFYDCGEGSVYPKGIIKRFESSNDCFMGGGTEAYHLKNHTIHSVKRLSDGEVIEVGKEYRQGKLFELKIDRHKMFGIFSDNRLNAHIPIEYITTKPKVPLFTTEDGVEIFEGDKFILLNCFNWTYCEMQAPKEIYPTKYPLKYLSTSEKAKEHMILNRPWEVCCKKLQSHLELNMLGANVSSIAVNVVKNIIREFFKSEMNK